MYTERNKHRYIFVKALKKVLKLIIPSLLCLRGVKPYKINIIFRLICSYRLGNGGEKL